MDHAKRVSLFPTPIASLPAYNSIRYGPDNMNETMIELQKSLGFPKYEVLRHIEEQAKIFPGLKWIGVATNPWAEPSVNYGLFGVNIPSRTMTLFSGAGPFNSTSETQVGRGIASLLSLPITNPSTPRSSLAYYSNNFVYISSFLLTQQRLFESAKRVTDTMDKDWTVTNSGGTARPCNDGGPNKSLLAGNVSPGSANYQYYLPASYTTAGAPTGSMIVADVTYAYKPGFGYALFQWSDTTQAFGMANVGYYRNRNSNSGSGGPITASMTSGKTACP